MGGTILIFQEAYDDGQLPNNFFYASGFERYQLVKLPITPLA